MTDKQPSFTSLSKDLEDPEKWMRIDKPIPDFDWSEIETLRKELSVPEKAPPGSFTVHEYAEKFGVKRSAAGEQLLNLLKQGKIKRGKLKGRGGFYYYL